MKNADENILAITNFNGPIDFLLHLVQKSEIDISDIFLHEITKQYLDKIHNLLAPSIDSSAEFIGSAASLLLLKSKMLLPKHEQTESLVDEEPDPRFDIIHQLIDYCRFKDVAKALKDREENIGGFYNRGIDQSPEIKKNLGVDHISLTDLASMFEQMLTKAAKNQGFIQAEVWRVSDKMAMIRRILMELNTIRFDVLFNSSQCREELITTFLAMLELMKQGEACVVRDLDTSTIIIMKPHHE